MLDPMLGYWSPDQPVMPPQGTTGPDGTTSSMGGLGGALRSLNSGITGGLGRISGSLFQGNPMLEQMMGPQQLAQARQQAMLQAGLGMLSSGSQPGVRFGQALAQGLQGGMQSYQGALGNQFAIAQHLRALHAPIAVNKDTTLLDPVTMKPIATGVQTQDAPVAVIDPATKQPKYVTRDQAFGMTPANDLTEGKPLTELGQLNADLAAGRITKEQFNAKVHLLTTRAQDDAALLGPDDLNFMADQYLAGDKSVITGLGRGAQGASNVIALRKAIRERGAAAGMTPASIAATLAEYQGTVAGERTLGNRTANVEMAGNEAANLAGLARQASVNVPRGNWVPVNKAIQMYQAGTSNKELAQFATANQSLINAYARAISPTGVPTDLDKQHGTALLSTATSQEAYNAVIDQMLKEIDAARAAPGQVRGAFRQGIVGGLGGAPAAPAAGGAAPLGAPAAPATTPVQAPTATGPNGQKLILQNGRWVPFSG